MYEKFNRVSVDSVKAGDICAVCGINDIQVMTYWFCIAQLLCHIIL